MVSPAPVKWTYPDKSGAGCLVIPVSSTGDQDIEKAIHALVNKLKNFDVMINYDLPRRLDGYLKERLFMSHKQHLRLIHKYLKEIDSSARVLKHTRDRPSGKQLRARFELILEEDVNELTECVEDLHAKAQLIDQLKRINIDYYNVAGSNPDKNDNGQALERKLIRNNRNARVLCSDDTLNKANQSKLDDLINQVVDEHKTNPQLRITYADFSYCTFKLSDMTVLPSEKLGSALQESKSHADVINILLVGETGVGKSTFINAFVNYLTFNTLREAETGKPLAPIPVSFLLTTGHNFDEHLVKFGDFSPSNNEDFNHPGHSVTQRCKSHLFDLTHTIGKKLCIIDTPGFGDTRGIDQDDTNMQHVLKYVKSLTHIDAVCFLLKPNVSRLHVFFRTCLTQLFNLLGPSVHQNIIFCFTNARSTAYAPGDTAPLLRSALNSFSPNDIPFTKENTFCFDSESFRYLVALQNGIRFDNDERHDYETSWVISVKEANRLLNYITTQLNIRPLHNEWQSDEPTEVDLTRMVRPMLEAMRNILRNLIIKKTDSPNKSIEMHSKALHQPTAFCFSCDRDSFLLNNFWVIPDHPHVCRNQCLTCPCESNQHISADYLLSYDVSFNSSSYQHENEMTNMLDQLCLASVEFGHFLVTVAHSTKEDHFHMTLVRIVREEQQLCTEKNSNHLNMQLVKELEKLLIKYEDQMKRMQTNQKHLNSQVIYERIKTICRYPIIHEQLVAIRQTREKLQND